MNHFTLVDGHDSQEDAATCMELMLMKVKEDLKKNYWERAKSREYYNIYVTSVNEAIAG